MSQTDTIQTEISIQKGSSVLDQLIKETGLKETKLIEAASKGAIWHKKPGKKKLKRIRDISHSAPLGMGHILFVNYNAAVLAEKPLEARLLSDQKNYSIWYKPKGMWSQGSKWGDHCTITEAVRKIHGKPALLVHRLDKASSGLMIIAHTKRAAERLSALFTARQIEKHYTATVHGHFETTLPFKLDAALEGKQALTIIENKHYDVINNTTTLILNIKTGRKHQIRQHLSQAGFPIVGDRLYGNAGVNDPDLLLEAHRLAFRCPFTDVELRFELDEKKPETNY